MAGGATASVTESAYRRAAYTRRTHARGTRHAHPTESGQLCRHAAFPLEHKHCAVDRSCSAATAQRVIDNTTTRQQFGFESRRWLRAVPAGSAALHIRCTTHSRQLSTGREDHSGNAVAFKLQSKQSGLLCRGGAFFAAVCVCLFVCSSRQAGSVDWATVDGERHVVRECTWRVPQPSGHVSAAEDQPAPMDDGRSPRTTSRAPRIEQCAKLAPVARAAALRASQ
jgi:hypothetical protein